MKKIFILSLFVLMVCGLQAQDKTVTEDLTFSALGTSTDVVVKNGTLNYDVYVKPYSDNVRLQTTLTRTVGTYTKAHVYVQGSFDYVTWTTLSTTNFASSSSSVKTLDALLATNCPYIRVSVAPYDSTQTVKVGLILLIDKTE